MIAKFVVVIEIESIIKHTRISYYLYDCYALIFMYFDEVYLENIHITSEFPNIPVKPTHVM